MSGYCVRITEYPTYGDRIVALAMSTDYESILSFKHKGDTKENPHFHLVIRTQVKMKAFRARFVKIFDLGKGNEHMSIKVWDGNDHAYSYMLHEDPDGMPFFRHNVSDEKVEEFRTINKSVSELVANAKGKASFLLEEIVLKQLEKNREYSDLEIGMMIMRSAINQKKYHPNDFQMRLYVDRIQYMRHELESNEQEHAMERIVRRALKLN